jgi:S1-C subfamily serine protease
MSVRMLVLGALSATAAVPAGLVAQERQQVSRPRIYFDDQEPQVIRDRIRAITQRRARLGISVDLRESHPDSGGARIQTVTPGGPAAKVGIKSGDIITKLGDTQVGSGLQLVEMVAKLKPAETITLEYLRDGARKTTSLVTGNEIIVMDRLGDGGEFTFTLPEGTMFEKMPLRMEGRGGLEVGPRGGFAYAFGGPLMDVELAPLNPDLGTYFGTTEGVLVINVPKDSPLGVKGGDVILSVDGRKATGPNGFLRILRSYDPGDSFKLEIMRNKARTTVTGTLEKPTQEQ